MKGTQHNDKIQDKSCISIPLASAQMQLPMSGSTSSTSVYDKTERQKEVI
jgi:hypothetical protein